MTKAEAVGNTSWEELTYGHDVSMTKGGGPMTKGGW